MLNAVQLASRQNGLSAADISRTFQIPLKAVQSWEKGETRPPAWVESKITSYIQQQKKYRHDNTRGSFHGFPANGFQRSPGFSRPANFPK